MKVRILFTTLVVAVLLSSLLAPFAAGQAPGAAEQDTPTLSEKELDQVMPQAPGCSPEGSGGPDPFGYTFKDSDEPDGPIYSWVEISGTINIPFGDDTIHGPYATGFAFNFYGTDYTEFYATSNGMMTFDAASTSDLSNDCPLPNANGNELFIAGIWDDLDNDAVPPVPVPGTGWYESYAAGACPYGGYAGACLIVEWDNMYHYSASSLDDLTFEIILFDDGDFLIQIDDASNELGSGSTTGIENADATIGLTYGCDTAASLHDGLAIEFLYPSGVMLTPAEAATSGCEGDVVSYTLNLANFTGSDGTFDIDYVSAWPISGPDQIYLGNGANQDFLVEVTIPCGGVSDVATVTASGFGYSASSTLTTSSTAGGFLPWESLNPINGVGRSRPAGAAANGKVYVLGGEISGGRADTVEEFDPATGVWTTKAGLMPVPASNVCAAAIGNDIYMPGGYGASSNYLNTLQVYHTDTDTWEVIDTDPLPVATSGIGCAALDGKLYAFGGSQSGTYTNQAYVYDPAAAAGSRWTALANMSVARGWPGGTAVNGKVYAVGGYLNLADVEAYDPADGMWHTVTSLNTARGGAGAMVYGDNLVVCAGGWSSYYNTCEMYDTTQGYGGVWTNLAETMITGRRTYAYASLPDALYAVAGYNGTFLTAAERLPIFECGPCEPGPAIVVTPESLYAEQCPDEVTQQTLQICNVGDEDLEWSLSELVPPRRAFGFPAGNAPQGTLPDGYPQTLTQAVKEGLPARAVQPVAPSVPSAAPEALTFYADRPTFDGDFPGLPVEGYENYNYDPGIWGFGMPLDQYTNNAVWSTGAILPGISFWASGGDPGNELVALGPSSGFGNPSMTVLANTFVQDYIVRFDPPVAAAGMDLQSLLGANVCDIDIYGTGGYLGSATAACNAAGVFWGVASDGDLITEIWISDQADGAEGADTVAFGGGEAGIPWLSEDPTQGFVLPGECQDVTVTFDSTGLAPDDYFGGLLINSNDPDDPEVFVPVQLTVLPCEGLLHVGGIRGHFEPDWYTGTKMRADVLVLDETGAPVAQVDVYALLGAPQWPKPRAWHAFTKPNGAARFVWRSLPPGKTKICILDLTLAGYTYDPASNVETCKEWVR